MSLAEYHLKLKCPKPEKSKMGPNKFNASKIKLDGMTFDSTKEYKRYIQLKAQQRGGIKDLQHYTKFELAPKTKIEGEKRTKPALRYFADLTYFTATGVSVVENVKSAATRKLASYRNKKHLMKTVHNIDVREFKDECKSK
jgi:hypothetical protein